MTSLDSSQDHKVDNVQFDVVVTFQVPEIDDQCQDVRQALRDHVEASRKQLTAWLEGLGIDFQILSIARGMIPIFGVRTTKEMADRLISKKDLPDSIKTAAPRFRIPLPTPLETTDRET